jgi:hypothetical protein
VIAKRDYGFDDSAGHMARSGCDGMFSRP